ncbi:hypothetical protein D9619_012837 [Psilocybe cf. subviscida]|uniref:Uncharacterized protein n=1 Tax=Psilocybe cf. subviscida TaxID=2480587 RepID=A0A8H5EQU8_9AGAR|nr:hypothetical protein D9619_012837 [Psilocybe cf. subviscida]
MKRVERRGTLESQALAAAQASGQQHHTSTIRLPPSNSMSGVRQAQAQAQQSQPQPPSNSQGSSIGRSDTLINAASFRGDSGRSTTHAQPSITVSSGRRGQPPAPAITALGSDEQDEDEEEDDDDDGTRLLLDDDIPTSNIGRGGVASRVGSKNNSRAGSRTRAGAGSRSVPTPPPMRGLHPPPGHGASNSAYNKRSPLARGAGGSDSPLNDDDADGEADSADPDAELLDAVTAADAGQHTDPDTSLSDAGDSGPRKRIVSDIDVEDGDADAELLEAVDAAEAISSSGGSERGGRR